MQLLKVMSKNHNSLGSNVFNCMYKNGKQNSHGWTFKTTYKVLSD